jgi:ribosomal protein L13E
MATKKQNPAVAKRIADRKAFVKDKVASKGITPKQARQRFYVQSRMAEMKAAGKTVGPEQRKQLQQKFQSGNVSRKGFAAPAKKTGTTTSTVKPVVKPVVKPATTSTSQAVRASDKRSAANLSATRTGLNANHANRGASQVVRRNENPPKKPKKVVIPKK